jgi:hypothetical protein
LPWGKHTLSVECAVKDAQHYTMRLVCETQQWEWESTWGEEKKITLI